MLMLQRAAENVNPSECNDPAVLLACSLGSDSCPAACQKKAEDNNEEEGKTPSNISDMPVAGDLTIAVADYSDSVKSAPAVGTVVFNAVDFKSSEKVTIESIKLERTGLSSKSDIKGVWFEKGGVAVSSKASLSSDGTATTRFYNNYSVNGTDTLDLVVELSGSAGSEIAFKLIDSVTTAKNVSLNTQTTTYRTTNYNVAKLTFEQNWGNTSDVTYKLWEKQTYEIGKFSIQNSSSSENKDVVLKSIKFRNEGAADLTATIKNVYVTRDGKTVSKNVELSTREMTIYFDDNQLDSGKKGIYTIFAETVSLDRVGDNIKLQLRKSSELVANEKTTNFRVKINDEVGTNWTLKNYIFNGWKINLTTASNFAKTVDAAPSSSDVVIAQGTITVAEAVRFEGGIYIDVDSVSAGHTDKSQNATDGIIDQLKVEIGWSTYSLDFKNAWGASGRYETTEDIYVSKTSDVKVLVSLNWVTENNQKIVFGNIRSDNLVNGRYESNDQSISNDIAWTIQIADLNVKAGKFNITNKSSSTQKVVKNTSDVVTIFDGEITAKDGTVSVTELKLEWSFSQNLNVGDQISLTVYVNGDPYSDAVYKTWNNYVTFANLGDVSSNNPMKIKITAQPNIVDLTGSITFGVSAEWTDANGNTVKASKVNAAKLEITNDASATIANSTASSTAVRDWSNAELLTFTTTVKDWSYNLTKLEVALTEASDVLSWESVSLEIDGSSVDSTEYKGIWSTSWSIEFKWLNETLEVGKHTFVLKSNLNVITTGTPANTIKIESVTLNGDAKTTKNLNVTKKVVKAYPTIAAKTAGDDLILTITNPKDSDEDVTIVWFGITAQDVVASASINWKVLTGWVAASTYAQLILPDGTAITESIAPGDSIEFRIQPSVASVNSNTLQVNSIILAEGTLTSDYTNIGNWPSFKVTAKK